MKTIRRWTSTTLALFLITLTLHSPTATAQTSVTPTPQRHIEVSGEGKIYATPDIALLTLSFSQRDKQALRAKKTIDSQVSELLALAKRLQIEDKDIQAARLTIYPEYDHKNNRQLIGYNVSREVQVKLRDLLNYPKLLEGSVEIGATHAGQLQLDFSNRKELENQALQAAFKDARQQAKLLAEVSGDQLGKTLWIHAAGGRAPAPMKLRMAMMDESATGASYPTGEMALSRHVQVRFALND